MRGEEGIFIVCLSVCLFVCLFVCSRTIFWMTKFKKRLFDYFCFYLLKKYKSNFFFFLKLRCIEGMSSEAKRSAHSYTQPYEFQYVAQQHIEAST